MSMLPRETVTINRIVRVGLGVGAIVMFLQSMLAFIDEERYFGWLGLLVCAAMVALLIVDWRTGAMSSTEG